MKIKFNFNHSSDPSAAFFALYAGLRIYKELKDSVTEPDMLSIPGAEAFCMLMKLKEKFPEQFAACEREYNSTYAGVYLVNKKPTS